MNQILPKSLGDSLRSLAILLDRAAPGLMTQREHPNVSPRLTVILAKSVDVESLATLVGGELLTLPHEDTTQTHMNLTVGQVELHAFAIEPTIREVTRPVTVQDPGGEGDWQLKDRDASGVSGE